ncbi:MAPEG family protein [Sphingomonas sp. SUN039]|uniref:MAPEG family protein n=1 Tax=Sphingomonas sp. SUN039 TaxID=2937787 RepID=UPI0021643A0B|nr:MAPEG family protein [Sphingomonas sp. SUN039]UVO55402.1 MAPEG family protein [Sphingomonas sp. SUN039]
MIILPITLTAAAGAALINLWLAIRCGQVRTKQKINMGDGGNEMMIAAMRAQANHVEFTPFVLILLAVIELAWGSPTWLWIVSGAYLLARVLHGLGMSGTFKPGRGIGILVTMLVTLGLAGLAIAIPYLTPQAAQTHQIRLG